MNFNKYFNEYDKYSYVQKRVATNLIKFIKENKTLKEPISTIFEIGCGTGIFTKEYKKEFKNIKKLILNDKFNVKEYIKNIEYSSFLEGDITTLNIPQIDLILSSSVFQWIDDLDKIFYRISNSTKNFYFSIYTFGNLIEIKKHFGISLDYKKVDDIEKILKKYFNRVVAKEEIIKLDFEKPIDTLKHLKYTGVTGLQKPSIINIRTFEDKSLTYKVAYFLCEN